MIGFYWSLGKDIVEKQYDNHYGSSFYKNLSSDLRKELANVEGLSERNIRYMKAFYSLYCQHIENLPQTVADSENQILPQLVAELSSIPWGHHRLIIDKCKDDVDSAVFYVHKVHQEGWSRDMLLNFISTDLYEREGTNQPIAISEYELQKLYPENVEGTIPTIAEIEDAIVIPDVEEHRIDNNNIKSL